LRATVARQRIGRLAGMVRLGGAYPRGTVPREGWLRHGRRQARQRAGVERGGRQASCLLTRPGPVSRSGYVDARLFLALMAETTVTASCVNVSRKSSGYLASRNAHLIWFPRRARW